MAISTTAGGSGSYTHGATAGVITLFTTPSVSNAIYIVTLQKVDETAAGASDNYPANKFIVGPNTDVKIYDGNVGSWSDYRTVYHWVQMVIS